jgi:DNA-binding NarL/FixJ family response regulator
LIKAAKTLFTNFALVVYPNGSEVQLGDCDDAHCYERATPKRLALGQGSQHNSRPNNGFASLRGGWAGFFFTCADPNLELGRLLVGDNIALIGVDEAQALTQVPETAEGSEEICLSTSGEAVRAITDGFIAVIESRTFIGECIRRSVQSAFPLPVRTYSTAIELEQQHLLTSPHLIIFSWVEDNKEANTYALKVLSGLAPSTPVIVLAHKHDTELPRTAICHGAKGYIPVTLGFDIAIEAVRFVLAGGTYVPINYLLMGNWPGDLRPEAPPASGPVTARELAVVRAIQHGKSNKIIAYELGMCESTVKVHVRRIMKKLNAKNRTDVAIKSQTVLSSCLRTNTRLELSAV